MAAIKIIIKAEKIPYLRTGQQPVIRIEEETYNTLVDLANESGLPLRRIASEIIRQGAELVVFDRSGLEGDQ